MNADWLPNVLTTCCKILVDESSFELFSGTKKPSQKMPANFNENFWSEHGRQLLRPALACLKLDSMTYKTLLFQINEDIGFDNSGIWLLNKERANQKLNSFFDLAINQSIELAITPEYSYPWEIASTLLNDGKFPDIANLWVLGMASINPHALKQMSLVIAFFIMVGLLVIKRRGE